VWNKIDRLDEEGRARLFNTASRREGDARPIPVSALTGEGMDALLAAIGQRLARERVSLRVDLDAADGRGLSWLYRHSEVLERREDEGGRLHLAVRVPPDRAEHIERRFGAKRIKGAGQ
jgi:GTP-binding protein HflX